MIPMSELFPPGIRFVVERTPFDVVVLAPACLKIRNGRARVMGYHWVGGSIINFVVSHPGEINEAAVPVAFIHVPQELGNVALFARRPA